MRFGPGSREHLSDLLNPPSRSDLHQLSDAEWLLIQTYRRACKDHQENILAMAQETLLICTDFSISSNVIQIRPPS